MPRVLLFWLFALGVSLFSRAASEAADLLPPDREISQVIDHYITQGLTKSQTKPAAVASDLVLLRRTTLDLAGRIPTFAETQEYIKSRDPKKRERLVDRLLSSPDFAFHHANELEAALMESHAGDRDFLAYLQKAASEDRPWDQMFREMIVGDETKESQTHATTFLLKRINDTDRMSNDTSRVFFGVAVNCAQCHDHPLVSDWKQDHYFGFKSFFTRTYQTAQKTLAERYSGEVKFKTTEGKEKAAAFMFLTGATVEEPKLELSKEERKKQDELIKKAMKDKNAPAPKPPAFRPREELVKLALDASNNRFFSKNIVNRIWARFLGRGLVHPLDQLHSENPATHPDLLAWLTRDTVKHGYRLKRLIRGIALSDTYARESRWTEKGDVPSADTFAIAKTRVLTPKQYALSLSIASASPEKYPLDISSDDWAKTREGLENTANGLSRQMDYPSEHFQVSVSEALYFSNNDRVQNDFLRDSTDRLVGYLKIKETPEEIVKTAFRATLGRDPEPEELSVFGQYLEQRPDKKLEGIQQITWALLTSPELRFNY